ncbi:MAG: hypothetical protein OXH65_07440 [Paracoccaceae bacterium]|nr:hypothetical protein [Paracoccaceae bacterium]MYJ87551.1 hypothetical protein [Paracoccaceae bacterium]
MKDFFLDLYRDLIRIIHARLDNSKLEGTENLIEFIHSRAAYVAQTSLYGYLKTRMGRQYVDIFKDEFFAPSLNKAKWELYFACLSDLTVYAISNIVTKSNLTNEEISNKAKFIFDECVARTLDDNCPPVIMTQAKNSFMNRSQITIWANAAIGENAFSLSPETLANSSPVTEEFQELDREIVLNSVRFRWNNIREEFQKRYNSDKILDSW